MNVETLQCNVSTRISGDAELNSVDVSIILRATEPPYNVQIPTEI
ncbi:hypothetical protein [Nostoc sp. TCL26-01]|nr:hypothetical protein [Nostoc sp. TCL26-01]